ncbi:30S ribosomal protein S9, partial [bacterium]
MIEQNYGTGRRKTSTARVYLRPGNGAITINGKTFEAYFGNRPTVEEIVKQPLKETNTLGKYDVLVNVGGGGPVGQAGAIRHGITR